MPQSPALRSPAAAGGDSARQNSGAGLEKPSPPGATSATGETLSKEQEAKVRDLKKRDAEVRAHEQAHAAVGGSYASAPQYTYTKGPDGKKYAVGGEVQIDTSPERTPEATIRKMDIVIAAALAPAEPSSQDQAVARQAQQQRQEAQQQMAQMQAHERGKPGKTDETTGESSLGMNSALMAQIVAQAQGADQGVQPAQAAAAASAYQSTAGLAAQIFGAAG